MASNETAIGPGDERVIVHTDGACSGNPGPGGWGVVLAFKGVTKEFSGGDPATTNNRMELEAAIQALERLTRPAAVTIFTDSAYVKNGIEQWLASWKKRGWKTAAKKPVANQDLWVRLDQARARHDVEWRWVKGHAGDDGNERADALARAATPR